MDPTTIPLRVLVLDHDSASTQLLLQALRSASGVMHVVHARDIDEARSRLSSDDINTVFVNPLDLGIERYAAFILETRFTLPSVVFVLFQDQERVEANREEFYGGERRRFSHYYRLDKRTPVDAFADELAATIRTCQSDLSWRMPQERLRTLLESVPKPTTPAGDHLEPPRQLVESVDALAASAERFTQENTVFVSHRFSAAADQLVQALTRHLGDKGFNVVTGKLATGYISEAVLRRIKDAEFFLSLLTRADAKADGTYTASAWLHQELGAAIALRKPVVLMVEEGITDFGGLQGDTQRIPFAERGFMNAALDATEILRAYAGRKSG